MMLRQRIVTIGQVCLFVTSLSASNVMPVSAACQVDNGANNGTDSGTEFGLVGFPGSDAGPDNDQGSWAPDNNWHDNWLKEWCEPDHDWVHDNWIRWSGARWDKLQQFKDSRRIAQDVNIKPETSYNYVSGTASSTLPWTNFYTADPFEQWQQGYEEISFLISDVSRIGKGVNYNTRSQWNAEGPPLTWIQAKTQWTDNVWYNTFNWDVIGRMDGKKVDQD